jgi:hypothetical protein
MRSEESRELNALVDAGLASYTSAEPRLGMEERILRSVLAEKTPRRVWWPWAVGALASACVLAIVIFALMHANTVHAPSVVQSTPAEHAAPLPKIATPETQVAPRVEVAGTAKRGGKKEIAGREAMALANHRSTNVDEMFPSPQVLSEEESTIIAMVEQHPAEISQALIEAQRRSAEPVRVAAIHIEPLNNGGQQKEE